MSTSVRVEIHREGKTYVYEERTPIPSGDAVTAAMVADAVDWMWETFKVKEYLEKELVLKAGAVELAGRPVMNKMLAEG